MSAADSGLATERAFDASATMVWKTQNVNNEKGQCFIKRPKDRRDTGGNAGKVDFKLGHKDTGFGSIWGIEKSDVSADSQQI